MRRIPRSMCTQHPDYANIPSWVQGEFIQGDLEVHEAYLAYSLYGCEEVMWDFEGKDVDIYVVRKLLSRYGEFFTNKVLGRDVYLTYRIPNPNIEVAEKKVFAEALESIPTAFDVASRFYGKPVPAVFEVIYPFTTSHSDLLLTLRYYERVVVGKENVHLRGGFTVRDWIGEVNPRGIEVIPLVEDMESLIRIDDIVFNYIELVKPRYLRVFIARSDPAMNYGLVPAVLLAKLAISKVHKVGLSLGLPIYPMIGVGPLPFRGHFNPLNLDNVLKEYEGVATFTVQSAFRYDYPEDVVRESVDRLNKSPRGEPRIDIDEASVMRIVRPYVDRYQREIEGLAELINRVSVLVPPRRARKLHVGLFGYSRGLRGVTLPRAITFVASLYSLGIPPEFLGLASLRNLKEEDWATLEDVYLMWRHDISTAAQYICWECLDMLKDHIRGEALSAIIEDIKFSEEIGLRYAPTFESKKHIMLSQLFLLSLINNKLDEARNYLVEMAKVRRALG